MMKKKPFLLLSNDDGYAAKGIQELIKVLRPMANLMVVAPSGPPFGSFRFHYVRASFALQTIGFRIWLCFI